MAPALGDRGKEASVLRIEKKIYKQKNFDQQRNRLDQFYLHLAPPFTAIFCKEQQARPHSNGRVKYEVQSGWGGYGFRKVRCPKRTRHDG